MEALLFRLAKAIFLFAVMYYSLRYLGVARQPSVTVSLIPLVLGILNIMAGPAYGMTAAVFVCAALSSLLPAEYGSVGEFISKGFSDISVDRVRDKVHDVVQPASAPTAASATVAAKSN
jgi:hypothetical protein